MNSVKSFSVLLPVLFLALLGSCKQTFDDNNYTAYFGGEVLNPKTDYVLLYKDDVLIDSLRLGKDNRFFKKFDSLAPGLYTFRHDPEYQYVYFDKNDSLLVSINSKDFDESIVFTGRGERKNNFLMEVYLMNERDRDSLYAMFDYGIKDFLIAADRSYKKALDYYRRKKLEIQWSDDFDHYAIAAVELPYYSKKEMYPVIHKIRTGEDLMAKMPRNYYDFRKKVNFSNEKLGYFSPYVKYLSHMLNNVAAMKHRQDSGDEATLALKANTSKMQIADTLIRNQEIKNMILTNIAYNYLMEDQNMENNQQFFETYHKYSTDTGEKNEIRKISDAIQALKPGRDLPEVSLVSTQGDVISSKTLQSPAVIFFWTNQLNTHLVEAHKKILAYRKMYPDYRFIAINLDDDQEKWLQTLENYRFDGIEELRASDFEEIRTKWAITKIHRTIILNSDGTIKDGFTNIFESDFVKGL